MKISILQMPVAFARPDDNIKTLRRMVAEAMRAEPDVLVLPELWRLGFYPQPIAVHADLDGQQSRTVLAELARTNGVNIVGGTVANRREGKVYNINADTMAAHISGAMGAECLISMTDIAGIMEDPDDPASLVPYADINDAVELFRRGVIKGGMIPKVESCIEALLCGVKKVFILDGRVPHSILLEMLTDEGSGTMMVGEKK